MFSKQILLLSIVCFVALVSAQVFGTGADEEGFDAVIPLHFPRTGGVQAVKAQYMDFLQISMEGTPTTGL
jgi:hypothetical protein